MKTIQVKLGKRSHSILIKQGLLKEIPALLNDKNKGQKWLIISHYKLLELFGFALMENLKKSGFKCEYITLPVGETAKSFIEYRRIISQMVELGCDRSTNILCLGGGVVGDVGGFAAATFMRGINYYQIPTTLLAMVDSALGGKTGINLSEGKNLIGHVYQPRGIFIDPDLLNSLPPDELNAGLSEILKYGIIQDQDFFHKILKELDTLDSFNFTSAIIHCCRIKAGIISRDETEQDLRRILNFGHTVGHALEAYLGFGRLRHGEAVAYGMLSAGWISKKLGLLKDSDFALMSEAINKLPLPKLPPMDMALLLPFIKMDKKNKRGILNYVVLKGLGNAVISTDVSEDLILKSLKYLP
ncbi:MAG: 3-dehydroquinate synthase [Candidatus Neomarinimicrobiota bacterium]